MVNQRWDSTDSQTLIERFDSKNSTHITAIVAIIFGAFTILTFLQGKGLPPWELSVWYLFIIEIVFFPLAIFYCLIRSFYYSWCAEKVKVHSELFMLETQVSNDAVERLPIILKQVARYRCKMKNSQILGYFILPLWTIWILIVLAVLTLPLN